VPGKRGHYGKQRGLKPRKPEASAVKEMGRGTFKNVYWKNCEINFKVTGGQEKSEAGGSPADVPAWKASFLRTETSTGGKGLD